MFAGILLWSQENKVVKLLIVYCPWLFAKFVIVTFKNAINFLTVLNNYKYKCSLNFKFILINTNNSDMPLSEVKILSGMNICL